MSAPNIILALQMIDGLLATAQRVGAAISTAQAEGRDLSAAELDGFFAADAAKAAELQAEIDRQRAAGG